MSEPFDLLVLGGGSGGVATARRAARYGARVGLIEMARLGGTCVNVGCVPKKLMWHAGQIADTLSDAAGYGFDIPSFSHDWQRLRERREAYIRRLNDIYRDNLVKSGVTLIEGHGCLLSATEVECSGVRYAAKNVLIATGGRPQRPETAGAELGIDSDGFFALDHCPKRIAVVGGGYIAVELCGLLRALGAEVTLIARGERLLSSFDAMLGETLAEQMQQQGIRLLPGAQVKQLQTVGAAVTASLSNGEDLSIDCLIWATGRVPNSRNCGLVEAGVKLDRQHHVVVDEWQATNVEGIYAVGDVAGHVPLTPVAIAAGRRLADRLFGGKTDARLDYENIPSVVFSHPAIGSVGMTESAARKAFGAAVTVFQSRFKSLYYGVIDHKPETRMKLVCVGPEQRVVGLHVIGAGADEMLQGFAVAIKMGATKRDFDDTVAIHPTAAEEFVTMP